MNKHSNLISEAKNVFEIEIRSIKEVQDSINNDFLEIVNLIDRCRGKLVVTGIGKSGHIGRKISSTMSSLGTPSFFLNPTDALHGDLGMIQNQDIVIVFSYSGETEEIIKLIPYIKSIGSKLICITGKKASTLVKYSDINYIFPNLVEACNMNLAPTSSTTAMLVFGDALAICLSNLHGFTEKHFALNHPSGSLGKKLLLLVGDIMHTNNNNSVVRRGVSIKDAIIEMSKKSLGIVNIINDDDELIGVFTDGDLRRIFSINIDIYNETIDSAMTTKPITIEREALAVDALNLLKTHNISSIPVLDGYRLIGTVRIMDIVRSGIDT